MNSHRTVAPAGLLAVLVLAVTAAAEPQFPAAPAALERFRALAGDWVAAADGEMAKQGDLVARYAVTAAGSAVVETTFPGSPHEMVTVYTAEGQDVVLTHYCIEGNQPRMRSRAAAGDRLDFAFDGGAGIDPQTTRHMHRASFRFLGPDEITSEWTELEGGETALVVNMHLRRKAS